MTQEKQLWIKDLCVLAQIQDGDTFTFKPYLRPLSSMTEEEEAEYWENINLKSPEMPVGEIPSIENIVKCSIIVIDWLNEHHFDYRGLIEKGLALEAPDGMYKTK